MDAVTLHDLSAAYVLDALESADLDAFEEHLSTCARCREEVADLRVVAGALALGAPPVEPPVALRGRILDAARAERASVTTLRPRWAGPLAVLAAAAACLAIGLGSWNVSLHDQLASVHSQLASAQSGPLARVALSGANGWVFAAPSGSGALVLTDLAAVPVGKTYEAWVIQGRAIAAAGLFRGGDVTTIVALSRPVPRGAVVAVTVEPAGGTVAPTRKPFIVSSPV